MFDFYDVGTKMKKIAGRFGTIGVILSVIYGFFTGYSIIKAGKIAVSVYDEGAVSEVSTNNTKPSANTNSGGYSLLGMASKRNNTTGEWLCKKCGAKNTKTAFFCKDCGEHK